MHSGKDDDDECRISQSGRMQSTVLWASNRYTARLVVGGEGLGSKRPTIRPADPQPLPPRLARDTFARSVEYETSHP